MLEKHLVHILLEYFSLPLSTISTMRIAGLTSAQCCAELRQGDDPRAISFVFTTAGSGDSGVLSLYVQIANSGRLPGNASLPFQPGRRDPARSLRFFMPASSSREFISSVYLLRPHPSAWLW